MINVRELEVALVNCPLICEMDYASTVADQFWIVIFVGYSTANCAKIARIETILSKEDRAS
jgi:hypothetical protein